MVALSQDAALNRPVEAREHVRRMHELFFTLAPDKAAIESNINRAMYLADKSLYSYYRDWNEKGMLMELLIATDAAKRASARSITAVITDRKSVV